MGRQGVTWAGKVAMKICPDILEELSSQVREKIFVVCGTNGKTTTNNMLCAGLEAEGKKVICNHTGSNMLNGVVAAFVLGAKFSGKLDADYACIEVDEASTRHVFTRIRPDYMVMTNLFRDQLDRYGEIDIIAAKGGELSFVEVKTRRNLNFGLPRLAVTYAKQQKIRSAALFYLQQENSHQQMLSFDVIEILVEGNVARLHHLPHCF